MMYSLKKKLDFLKLLACRSKSNWHSSNWQILKNNSEDYLKMMDLAYANSVYSQVLHNGHIAVELIVKSAISRQYTQHPHGHEIRKLTNIDLNGKKLLVEINSDSIAQRHFNPIYTAWKMQYRYTGKSVPQTEALRYLTAFKEAYKWTKNKYCL